MFLRSEMKLSESNQIDLNRTKLMRAEINSGGTIRRFNSLNYPSRYKNN